MMQNVTLKIDGMTCGGCVKSVTRVLSELDGVAQADVSLEKAQAVVSFDANKVQPAALVEAVEDAGFDAAVVWVLFIAYSLMAASPDTAFWLLLCCKQASGDARYDYE